MRPRKMWPVFATASASGFAQDIALAPRIKVTPTGAAEACVGRLVNFPWDL
jgi:hypothetical protein